MSGYKKAYHATVMSGNKIGHKIGVPTINIPVSDDSNLPEFGVYAAKVELYNDIRDETISYNGIANLGVKPTVTINPNGNPVGIEVNLFDFSEDIYDKEVTVYLYDYIRPERKFDNFEELTDQIRMDTIKAKQILGMI